MRTMRILASLGFLAVGLLAGAASRAQSVNATISGVVQDAKGGAVAKAAVTVQDTDKNIVVRTVETDEGGRYVVPLLPIGQYVLTVESAGFRKAMRTNIVLNVNDNIAVNFTLEVGTAKETVSVTANLLDVETQTAASAGLITGEEVREIPLNSRNYEQLVSLMPGVSSNTADQVYLGTTNPSGQANVVSFAIGGQRNSANNWTVDGADNVDRGSNLTLLTYPSVDAIAEFKVLRGLYDAEFGRGAGGQINVVTKSGSSGFHGDAYEFFRNDVLAANNFFNNSAGIKKPPLRYNDFGYTFGGPLFIPNHYNANKDKTFFFFSQEFRRVITYGTVRGTVPTSQMLQGTFAHTVCVSRNSSGTCLATSTQISTIDPVAQEYIQDIFSKLPAPNAGGTSLFSALRNVYNARQEFFRVDQVFGPKLNLTVRYIHDAIPTTEPGGLFTGSVLPGVSITNTNSPGYSWLARATSSFSSTLLNEGGFIFSYGAIVSSPAGSILAANSPDVQVTLPYTSTLGRVPSLTFNQGSSVTGFGPYRDYNRNYNVFDNLTKIAGRHTFKVGFVYNYYQKTENAGGLNAGQFSFSYTPPAGTTAFEQAWADFLTGHASSFTQAKADLTPDMRQQQFDVYGQDQFRVRKNLTVMLGLRYSRYNQPVDNNHYLSNFDPAAYDPYKAPTMNANGTICTVGPCPGGAMPNPNYDPLNGIIIAGQNSPYGNQVSNGQTKNFAPRIGVAWDPFGNGKTSLRAGYGIYYDSTLVGIYEQNIFANPPFAPNVLISNTTLGNPAGGALNVSASPMALRGTAIPNRTPYSQQWSLGVQRQLTSSLLLDVSYVGGNGVHLLGIVDINEVQPGLGYSLGLTAPPGRTYFTSATESKLNVLRPYLGYNAINVVESAFNSNYNSLQVAVQKRFTGNSLFNAYYTFSHNLTNNQSDRSTAPQNTYDIAGDYGPTQFDRRHILTLDYVYHLPFYKNQEGVLGHMLGGWQLSGIVNYSSGAPLTVTESTYDPAGLGFLGPSAAGGRPNITGNPNTNAPHTVAQYFNTGVFVVAGRDDGVVAPGSSGRGVVTGPGIERWDVAGVKNIKLHGEHLRAQFRGELFNVFNHTNFSNVDTAILSSTFGRVTSAHDARIVQLGLKLYF